MESTILFNLPLITYRTLFRDNFRFGTSLLTSWNNLVSIVLMNS